MTRLVDSPYDQLRHFTHSSVAFRKIGRQFNRVPNQDFIGKAERIGQPTKNREARLAAVVLNHAEERRRQVSGSREILLGDSAFEPQPAYGFAKLNHGYQVFKERVEEFLLIRVFD
jgi:hypothetical protein